MPLAEKKARPWTASTASSTDCDMAARGAEGHALLRSVLIWICGIPILRRRQACTFAANCAFCLRRWGTYP
eukprot:5019285-Pyramimonas_sp.AAC.1